jgi:ribosome-associated protein
MPSIRFELEGEHIALNDLLKVAGVVMSGGAGKALVASGAVQVDGRTETRKTCKIRAGQAVVVGRFLIRVDAARA